MVKIRENLEGLEIRENLEGMKIRGNLDGLEINAKISQIKVKQIFVYILLIIGKNDANYCH